MVAKKKSFHLKVVFKIALMVTKFRQIESEKFKDSLEYKFDKEEQLKLLEVQYPTADLIYLIRKFDLRFAAFVGKVDLENMLKMEKDEVQRYLICMYIRYLCRNSNSEEIATYIKVNNILDLVKAFSDEYKVKNELALILGYVINDKLSSNTVAEIHTLLIDSSDIADGTKAVLLSRIEANKEPLFQQAVENNVEDRTPSATNNTKKKELIVTKTIQTGK
jgi:hypothetical protein